MLTAGRGTREGAVAACGGSELAEGSALRSCAERQRTEQLARKKKEKPLDTDNHTRSCEMKHCMQITCDDLRGLFHILNICSSDFMRESFLCGALQDVTHVVLPSYSFSVSSRESFLQVRGRGSSERNVTYTLHVTPQGLCVCVCVCGRVGVCPELYSH